MSDQQDTPEEPAKPPQSNGRGCLYLAIVMVAAPVLLLASCMMGSSREPAKADPAANLRKAAVNACERQVSAKLKAPSTAKFDTLATVVSADGGRFTVSAKGTVDSQNSFGAMIRSTFRCDGAGSAEGNLQGFSLVYLT